MDIFAEAIATLSQHIARMAHSASPNGWHAATKAPDNYDDLIRAFNYADELGKPRIVWNGASGSTIYGNAHVNHAFRAWHDAIHFETGLDFNLADELEVARRQASTVADPLARLILVADTAGQSIYERYHGAFPADQDAFVRDIVVNCPVSTYRDGNMTLGAWGRDMAQLRRYIAQGRRNKS